MNKSKIENGQPTLQQHNVSNSTVRFDKFDQWIDWKTIHHGYSRCNYYIRIIYKGIVYKDVESIITNGKTSEDIKSQILTSRKKILLKLIESISDKIPVPTIKEERM